MLTLFTILFERRFPRRKIVVAGPKQQFQADLIDFSRLQKYNGGYKFILVVIDVFFQNTLMRNI